MFTVGLSTMMRVLLTQMLQRSADSLCISHGVFHPLLSCKLYLHPQSRLICLAPSEGLAICLGDHARRSAPAASRRDNLPQAVA